MSFISHGSGKSAITNFPPGFGVGVAPKVTGIGLTARMGVRMLDDENSVEEVHCFSDDCVGFCKRGGLAALRCFPKFPDALAVKELEGISLFLM